jgi:hypothetical protein
MSLRKAFLAVLVPLFALLLCAPAGSAEVAHQDSGSAARSGIPRTYDAALRHFSKATGREHAYKKFVTPSGNIYCALKMGIPTGCELSRGAIKDPDACPGNPVSEYVGRVEFHRGRAVPICNTDTIRTPGAKTLKYGDIAHIRGWHYACLSEEIGVTCINENKAEGFFLHRGEYVIFNAG